MTVPRDQRGQEAVPDRSADRSSASRSPGADGTEAARLELEPMEVDLVRIVGIGTILFAMAFLILIPMRASLERDGHGRWPWIALSGALLGLLGLLYVRRRAQRMSKVNAE
ncbi:MAG TPA: hypothetical protein VGS97_12770 [Actinocrinis sp.]|uniref:DUF2530 domain-containing protein n=1 Tax=Actinocrinis sp. TaxID=1920516 RepID=UPI002DDD4122|nr:hypothetical protein [Actinocrinis sp.]HEV2344961.1 hypothetical protein [Actinocrinis sp.]